MREATESHRIKFTEAVILRFEAEEAFEGVTVGVLEDSPEVGDSNPIGGQESCEHRIRREEEASGGGSP
jgi:hypothetical protein